MQRLGQFSHLSSRGGKPTLRPAIASAPLHPEYPQKHLSSSLTALPTPVSTKYSKRVQGAVTNTAPRSPYLPCMSVWTGVRDCTPGCRVLMFSAIPNVIRKFSATKTPVTGHLCGYNSVSVQEGTSSWGPVIT